MAVEISVLKSLSPLDSLNTEHLREVSEKSFIRSTKQNEYVFRQDDNDKRMIFLLKGTVELKSDDGNIRNLITGGTKVARTAIAHNFPRNVSALARTDLEFMSVDNEMIDLMLTWDETGVFDSEMLAGDSFEEEEDKDSDDDWMIKILQTKAFHKIPPANIQILFQKMELIEAPANKMIIKQGTEGDFYYIVRKGKCQVSRVTSKHPKGVALAELGFGDSFGEDSLISNTKRNASVASITDVQLMRLSKKDFQTLLKEPMLNWIPKSEAMEKIEEEDTYWLDVRLPSEYEQWHMPDSINIPLSILRLKLNLLSIDNTYIVYCDSGRRSSAAAYLLAENGVTVFAVEDGIQDPN